MSVGAMLRPGTAEVLFGATAEALAERHTPLDCVWGAQADCLHERLAEASTAEARLQLLERELLRRLPTVRGLHPAVAMALAHFDGVTQVQTVVEHSGYSHRRFIAQFRRAVGLTPKTYLRIQRFQRTLEAAQGREGAPDGQDARMVRSHGCEGAPDGQDARMVRSHGCEGAPDWSLIAADMGFADQSHLIRDFKAFAGVTPEQYRLAQPAARNHLPR